MTSIRRSGIWIGLLALTIAAPACDENQLAGGSFFLKLVPGNTTRIAERLGYRAQCQAWSGDICIEPWIALNGNHIVDPDPHCVDDTTSLRPLWFGDEAAQALMFCWIATGNSTFLLADNDGAMASHGGWMYGGEGDTPTDCLNPPNFRRHSTVFIPVVGPQTYSFDLMTEIRDGSFSRYECVW